MSLEITCTKCEAPVSHVCQRYRTRDDNGDSVWADAANPCHPNPLVSALIELLNWKPEHGYPEGFVELIKQDRYWYEEGDEDFPFLSQRVIYPLFGDKEDSRMFFTHLRETIRMAGFDPDRISALAHKVRLEVERNECETSGGVIRYSNRPEVDWVIGEGWSVDLNAQGVGRVTCTVKSYTPWKGRDYPNAGKITFVGGGEASFFRLLKVAHEIRNPEGEVMWPLEVEL